MGPAECAERIAEIRNAMLANQKDVAASLTVSLGGEVLGALFSIATSLEAIAGCVAFNQPNSGQDGAAFVTRSVAD